MSIETLLAAVKSLCAARNVAAMTFIEGGEVVVVLGARIDDEQLVLDLHRLDTDKTANYWKAPQRVCPCRSYHKGR